MSRHLTRWPDVDAMEDRKFHHCPNCDTRLESDWSFCPSCGQENVDRNVSFRLLFLDFLGDFFTFDSSFFRSLIPFLFRPGEMTKEYMQGRRSRYIPPVRILVFLCILLFAALSSLTSKVDWDSTEIFNDGSDGELIVNDSLGNPSDTFKINPELEITAEGLGFRVNIADPDSAVDNTEEGAELVQATAQADSILSADSTLSANALQVDSTLAEEDKESIWNRFGNLMGEIPELSKAGLNPEEVVDSLLGAKSSQKADEKIIFGLFVSKRKILLQSAKVYQSSGEGVVSFIIGNGTITILLAVFVLALLLKLLYIRRKKHFVEHFIFSTHSHAALVFITLIGVLLKLWFDVFPNWLYAVLIPYYIISMKRFYGQRWGRTIFKYIIIASIYSTLFLTIFMVGALGIAFLFF